MFENLHFVNDAFYLMKLKVNTGNRREESNCFGLQDTILIGPSSGDYI